LAVVEHARRGVLPGDAGRGLEVGMSRDAQRRSGVQFTAEAFTGRFLSAGVAVSMAGQGRALDGVFVERLWMVVKY
jgi:putative transposase